MLPRPVAMLCLTAVLAAPAGCGDRAEPEASAGLAAAHAQEIGMDELEALMARDACTALDANLDSVRARHGTLPGATRLSHYERYALDELPADRARVLVFYCASESCGAAEVAAARALQAGYKDVRVLRAGILGWVRSGRAVDTRSAPAAPAGDG